MRQYYTNQTVNRFKSLNIPRFIRQGSKEDPHKLLVDSKFTWLLWKSTQLYQ